MSTPVAQRREDHEDLAPAHGSGVCRAVSWGLTTEAPSVPVLLNRDPTLSTLRGSRRHRRDRAEDYPALLPPCRAHPRAPVRSVTLEACRSPEARGGTDGAVRSTSRSSMLTLVPGAWGQRDVCAGSHSRARTVERVRATAYVAAIGAGFSQGVPESVVPGVDGGASTRARVTTLVEARFAGARSARPGRAPTSSTTRSRRRCRARPARAQASSRLLDVQHLDLPASSVAPSAPTGAGSTTPLPGMPTSS